MTSGGMDTEKGKRARGTRGHRTPRDGGSRNDARKMHRGKPAFNAGEWTYENPHSMRDNRRRKRRDVDVRNGREMVAGLTRKWASTTPVPSP